MDDKTITKENPETVHKHKGLSLFFGILLITVGLFAINARIFISTTTIYFFGWILLIGGGAQCFASLYSGSWGKFFITLVTGIISAVVGLSIVVNPAISVQTFAMFVGLVFMADGLFKFTSSLMHRTRHWGWSSATGLLLFLLGTSIWYLRPDNLGLIGLLVGAGLILIGFITITNAYTHRPTEDRRETPTHSTA